MIVRLCAILAVLGLSACDTIGAIKTATQSNGKGVTQQQPSRAEIESKDLAAVNFYAQGRGNGRVFTALSQNNSKIGYGLAGRNFIALRGGLLVETRGVGNALLTVKENKSDPIQFQRPLASWPRVIERIYHFDGEDINGHVVNVTCEYSKADNGEIKILGKLHKVQRVIEKCVGDREFKNTYMIDNKGFIWKSEQFIDPALPPSIVEIIEPLEI